MAAATSVEEAAYLEIKQRILDGRLPPGERLVLRTLAVEIGGISLVPVVSALRMLERDGLVVNTPGMGASVRQWTQKDIVHIYHIRAVHEGLAARLCVEEATAADMAAIVAADEAFCTSIDAGDAEANIRTDIDFHVAVVRGAHCLDLERTFENLSIMRCSMRAFGMSRGIPPALANSVRLAPERKQVHNEIINAILARDGAAAEAAGRQHVEDSLAVNLSWIEEVGAALDTERSPSPRRRSRRSKREGSGSLAGKP